MVKNWLHGCSLILAMMLSLLSIGCDQRGEEARTAQPSQPAAPAESGRFAKPVIVGTDAAYPPMEFVDSHTGQIQGYDIDFLAAVAQRANFTATPRNVDWDAIFPALDNKEIDAIISSVTITDERKQKYDFTEPYMRASQRLIVRKGEAFDLGDAAARRGKRIGAQIGTTGALLIEQKFPEAALVSYDSAPMALADLENRKLDGVMVDEAVAIEYTRLKPELAAKFDLTDFRHEDEYYGIVVRKGDSELLNRLNEGIRKAKEDGVDRDLQKKWLE